MVAARREREALSWSEVVKSEEDNFLRVEYEIDKELCGKTMHLRSQHLIILSNITRSSCEEYDPDAKRPSSQFQLTRETLQIDHLSGDASTETPGLAQVKCETMGNILRQGGQTVQMRAQQPVPVRLAGMMVPFSQQIDAGEGAPVRVSAGQIAEARQLLGVFETADRAALDGARRKAGLRYHPDIFSGDQKHIKMRATY